MEQGELASNALKYGALSVETGHVSITWEAKGGDDEFRLRWTERNGPTVTARERRGFGSRLLDEVLAADFGGTARIMHAPEGLRFELTTRMENLIEATS